MKAIKNIAYDLNISNNLSSQIIDYYFEMATNKTFDDFIQALTFDTSNQTTEELNNQGYDVFKEKNITITIPQNFGW